MKANLCLRIPNWNSCKWRDENTILSPDGESCLCHSQKQRVDCPGCLCVDTEVVATRKEEVNR